MVGRFNKANESFRIVIGVVQEGAQAAGWPEEVGSPEGLEHAWSYHSFSLPIARPEARGQYENDPGEGEGGTYHRYAPSDLVLVSK